MGALTKHGISCPIVGACTWQARYGYVNIMHADICVCFHALRVHHRFRRAALRDGPYELRTTNNEQQKSTGIFQCFFTRISGFLSSQGASPQVLSAFAGLTAVFGMGTGGSPQLSPLNYYVIQDSYPDNCIKMFFLTGRPRGDPYHSVGFSA